MNELYFRVRVAVLWVAAAVAAATATLLYVFIPGAVADLLAGEMEGEPLTLAVSYMFGGLVTYCLAMSLVTLFVHDRANHVTNVVAGLLLGLFGVFAVISHVLTGGFNGHVLMAAVAGVIAFVIAGLGAAGFRRGPTQEVDQTDAADLSGELTAV
jgi:multidrug efflux pump subunit AcrB